MTVIFMSPFPGNDFHKQIFHAWLPEQSYYWTNKHYKLLSAPAVTCQWSQHVCRIYDNRNRIFLYGASYLSHMMEFTWFCPKARLKDWLFCMPKAEIDCKRSHSCECYYHLTRLQFVIEGFPYFCIKRWSQHIFSTHRRLSWAPPGGEWRGCPSAAPSASWPPRSADSLQCSGRWRPLCGRRHKRSSGGL